MTMPTKRKKLAKSKQGKDIANAASYINLHACEARDLVRDLLRYSNSVVHEMYGSTIVAGTAYSQKSAMLEKVRMLKIRMQEIDTHMKKIADSITDWEASKEK